jgi:hypothetical protein
MKHKLSIQYNCNTILYPRNVICFKYVIVHTLLKGDNKDDDDDDNNNNGSRSMGEVAPLYGVDPALVLTNPGVQ